MSSTILCRRVGYGNCNDLSWEDSPTILKSAMYGNNPVIL